jgi:rhomboid protease GluP
MNGSFKMVVKENWLTAPPSPYAYAATALASLLLFTLSFIYFADITGADGWMSASGASVFGRGEYWRLWSTLFAHADLGHLMSNAFLFVPLTYMLVSHYSLWFFPLAGLLLGGATNWLVLKTMPAEAYLIGISGVVYWMGSAWLTLYLLIDRRDRLRRRIGASLFLTLILFVPETLRPEVSHLSHFLGYVIGVGSALVYYLLRRRRFLSAEVREYIFEPEEDFPSGPVSENEWEESRPVNIHN